MIFGAVGLEVAEGAILAHTTRVAGHVLKKGRRLDPTDLRALRAAGRTSVIAARLEAGDVAEDEAAQRLGDALASDDLAATRAATGRVNLFARRGGLLQIAAERVRGLNAVHESITLATLANAAPVGAGDIVATLKIIPFAVPRPVLARAERLARDELLRLHAWRPLRTGLVLSELAHLKPSVIEGTVAATRRRVEALGGSLLAPRRCAHESGAIAGALAGLLSEGAELLLVAGASAVVDRADVGPAGIVLAGGAIEHFGMPVDPGNLVCLGRVGAVPALVLPGCARSPQLNGIDLVLRRLFAGLGCTGTDLAGMGVGGLLKEASPRPLRRAQATRAIPPQPTVAAIVLAAGRSSRMAPRHKLLVDMAGTPMVTRVVDHVLSSRARPVLVVVGYRGDEVAVALRGRNATVVACADHADGISASLRAGLAALPASADAAVVVLGDMPLVSGAMLDRLVAAYDPAGGLTVVAATHRGALGNPVLWDRRHFVEMAALTGDRGARPLLERLGDAVARVELGGAAGADFDTPESLSGLVA